MNNHVIIGKDQLNADMELQNYVNINDDNSVYYFNTRSDVAPRMDNNCKTKHPMEKCIYVIQSEDCFRNDYLRKFLESDAHVYFPTTDMNNIPVEYLHYFLDQGSWIQKLLRKIDIYKRARDQINKYVLDNKVEIARKLLNSDKTSNDVVKITSKILQANKKRDIESIDDLETYFPMIFSKNIEDEKNGLFKYLPELIWNNMKQE